MTDEPAQHAAPETEPALDRARIEPSHSGRRLDFLPSLYFVGFLALAGTLLFLYENPPAAHLSAEQAGQVDTLQSQLAALRAQVTQLSQRPAATGPSNADLQHLQQQVNALQSRPSVTPDAMQQLSTRLSAVENKPGATTDQIMLLSQQIQNLDKQQPDIQALQQHVTALEARPQVDPSAIDGRFNTLTGQVKQLDGQMQQTSDAAGKLGSRIDQLDSQQKQTLDQVKSIVQKAQLATRLQAASVALDSGRKLGNIQGAPPALARFADQAPPTEPELRASFEGYAAAAQKANQPDVSANENFGSRMWARAQQAVTVRQGDRVIVGDPISGVLAHAKQMLDDGDLAGSVSVLKELSGPAAAAMQPWVDKARSLLDARSALATMAAG